MGGGVSDVWRRYWTRRWKRVVEWEWPRRGLLAEAWSHKYWCVESDRPMEMTAPWEDEAMIKHL